MAANWKEMDTALARIGQVPPFPDVELETPFKRREKEMTAKLARGLSQEIKPGDIKRGADGNSLWVGDSKGDGLYQRDSD